MKKEILLFPALALLFGIAVYWFPANRSTAKDQEESSRTPTQVAPVVEEKNRGLAPPTTAPRRNAPSTESRKRKPLKKLEEAAEAPLAKDNLPPFSFMGVISVGKRRCGLLRRNDGSDPIRVRVGDVLDRWGFKVTKIEKHAIHLKRNDGSFLVVRNNQFP
jgi:Tfp pilus assembly protein PilP